MRILISEKLSAHKYKTPEGYLVCVDSILARTGKQEYHRHELYGDSCDNPDEVVELNRPEKEVFDSKTLASFENKALCLDHPEEDVDSENHNQLSVGFVRDIKRGKDNGEDVMLGTLVITDQTAIDKVESGEYGELSCGYNCDISDADGKYTQTNIRGNHVALCQHGRAGIARIVDSAKDAGTHQETLVKSKYAKLKAEHDRLVKEYARTSNGGTLIAMQKVDEQLDKLRKQWAYCLDAQIGDAMDFSKKTKQGYDVLEMYRDGGRLHAIFKRANDYGIALGYDTTDGQWAQGMYDYTTLEKARKALMEEKPYARRIMDAIKDSDAYDKLNEEIENNAMNKSKLEALVKRVNTTAGLLGDEKQRLVQKANSMLSSLDRMNDSTKDATYYMSTGEHLKKGMRISEDDKDWMTVEEVSQRDRWSLNITLKHDNGKIEKRIIGIKSLWNTDKNYFGDSIKDVKYETSDRLRAGMKIYLSGSGEEVIVTHVERLSTSLVQLKYKSYDGYTGTIKVNAKSLWRIADSLKTFTVKYEKNGEMFIQKVQASTIQDAIKQVKEQRK